MPERTNDEWASAIATKVSEVLADTSRPEFSLASSITSPSSDAFPATIDHTLLKPDATPAQIDELCVQAIQYNFKVCTYPKCFNFPCLIIDSPAALMGPM